MKKFLVYLIIAVSAYAIGVSISDTFFSGWAAGIIYMALTMLSDPYLKPKIKPKIKQSL